MKGELTDQPALHQQNEDHLWVISSDVGFVERNMEKLLGESGNSHISRRYHPLPFPLYCHMFQCLETNQGQIFMSCVTATAPCYACASNSINIPMAITP